MQSWRSSWRLHFCRKTRNGTLRGRQSIIHSPPSCCEIPGPVPSPQPPGLGSPCPLSRRSLPTPRRWAGAPGPGAFLWSRAPNPPDQAESPIAGDLAVLLRSRQNQQRGSTMKHAILAVAALGSMCVPVLAQERLNDRDIKAASVPGRDWPGQVLTMPSTTTSRTRSSADRMGKWNVERFSQRLPAEHRQGRRTG